MSCVGNVIWMIFGGIGAFIGWGILGVLWSITIIGIPIGKQCFKIASFSLAPFGREIRDDGEGVSLILNILWIVLGGFEMFLAHLISALFLAITIVGLPFAGKSVELAFLSLAPFGKRIV
ncbi:MAG: YccF domain-containing protein [Streptococcaceae bacterium]|jgi:uncharacterized membrane protein YccF (DUF307 family)|nr:YccF domain-containing protein [Streptococcaceae bacterium]